MKRYLLFDHDRHIVLLARFCIKIECLLSGIELMKFLLSLEQVADCENLSVHIFLSNVVYVSSFAMKLCLLRGNELHNACDVLVKTAQHCPLV